MISAAVRSTSERTGDAYGYMLLCNSVIYTINTLVMGVARFRILPLGRFSAPGVR